MFNSPKSEIIMKKKKKEPLLFGHATHHQMQLAFMKDYLKPILQSDEIPIDGTFYYMNDTRESHWVATKLQLIGQRDGHLIFKDPTGVAKYYNYQQCRRIYLYDPPKQTEEDKMLLEACQKRDKTTNDLFNKIFNS